MATRATPAYRRYYEAEDRPRRLKAQALSILALLAGAGYLWWVWLSLNMSYPTAALLFLAAEVSCLLLFFFSTLHIWRLRFKPAQGLPMREPRSVDIFIPTCGEPLEVVGKTMQAAAGIQWHGPLTRYVLDDAGRPEVQALAASLGFVYLSRATAGVPNADAKAGNLNFGLKHSSGEFILCLDADQVPEPGIVQALAGYMRFPKVAFVQSRQSYFTPQGDLFYNRSEVFYDVIQLGLDASDAVISCGTGVLYRREALESIGGFVTWNIVEDLTTAYELHARGWQSFYLPHALSRGLAPTDIWSVYQQRGQWTMDTMRLFFYDNPLFKRGLTLRKRLGYCTVAFSYLCAAFLFPYFFSLPVWSYATGHSVLTRYELEFLLIRGFYFALMALAMSYLCQGRQPGKQFKTLAGLFPLYISGILRALWYPKGRKPAYRVNNRNALKILARQPGSRLLAVLPQLLILVLNATMPFYALYAGTCPPRLLLANVGVSAVAIWSMSQVVAAALSPVVWDPQDNPESFYATP